MKLSASDDLIVMLEEVSLYMEKNHFRYSLVQDLCEFYAICEFETPLYFSHYQAQCIADSLLEVAYAMGCYGVPRYDDLATLFMCQLYDLYVTFVEHTSARIRDSHQIAREFIVRHRTSGCVLEMNTIW